MTKKHYIALAKVLRLVACYPHADAQTHLDCCRAIAIVAESDNPRFDRARFLEACVPKWETT